MSLVKKLGFSLIAMVFAFAGCGEMDANEFEAGSAGEATGVILDTLGDQIAFMKYAGFLTKKDANTTGFTPGAPLAGDGPIANYLKSLVAANALGNPALVDADFDITVDPNNTTGQAGNLLAPNGIYKITIGGTITKNDNALLWVTPSTIIPVTMSTSDAVAPAKILTVTVTANTVVNLGLRKANLNDYITSGILQVTILSYTFKFYSATGGYTDLVPFSTNATYQILGDLANVEDVGRISFVNYTVNRTYDFAKSEEGVTKVGGFVYANVPATASITAIATAKAMSQTTYDTYDITASVKLIK